MWWWILIWLLLLVASAAFLGLVLWTAVVRRGIALGRQLGVSAEQVGDALQPLDVEYHPEPSVLVDPDAHPSGGPGARAAVRPPRPAAPGRDRARA